MAADGLFIVWILTLLYIFKKTTYDSLHFMFSCFVKGNAVAQVTLGFSSSQDQVEPLLELDCPRCTFNLKIAL